MPNLQNHSEKMAFATVSASLFSMAVTSAYFVKASVTHKMYLCWRPALEVGVTVVACLWMIFAAGIEGRFWYGGERRSKFEASSKTKLDGCMF